MIDSFAAALTVMSLIAAAAVFVRRERCWPLMVVLEGGLVLQAILALVQLFGGHAVGERGPFLAYLAVSVLVLPVVALQVRTDDTWWGTLLVAVGAIAVAVVVIRAQTTWRV